MKQGYTVGADVGGTHVRLGLLGPDGGLSRLTRLPRPEAMPDEDPLRFGEVLRAFIAETGAPVSAVGVGIPGTLSRDCRRALKVPNVPALDGLELADGLGSRAGVPVLLRNDTVMLLAGDVLRLGLPEEGLVLGIYIGTGLGSAVFLDGRPLRGRNGLNELGHFPIPGRKEPCTCGGRGCAENLVSGRRLQALRAEKWPETHISELFPAMAGSPELAEFLDAAACLLAGAVNLLDPEALVIGGGVPAMKGFPREELARAVREKAMHPEPAEGLRIAWSPGGDAAGVLGAARLAMLEA